MKLVEMKVNEFVDLMASDEPAPGGGSAAALEGALGAALTAMVCALTVGKKKYADVQELAIESQKKGNELKAQFVDVIDRDTEAFNARQRRVRHAQGHRRGEGRPQGRHAGGPEGLHQDPL